MTENIVAPRELYTRQSRDAVPSSPLHARYENVSANGPGLTVVGNFYNSGTLLQRPPNPEEFTKFGLCLGGAPQIDPAYFVTRATYINGIHRALHPQAAPTKQQRVLLGGMGGVGKTQLAIAYAERYEQYYDSIFWLNATSQLTCNVSLRLVAGRVIRAQQLERLNDDQVLARVCEWLSNPQNKRWLLIFDNYDEPKQFELSKYFPYAAHGSIVITTRSPEYVRFSSHQIRIQPLNRIEESLDILQKRSGRTNIQDDQYARQLAERLAGLPLALATAGAYLSKTPSMTFRQYFDVYQMNWNPDPRRPLQLQEYQDRTLYVTWDLSYARLQSDDPYAAQLLKLLAYFDNQVIWYELLSASVIGRSSPRSPSPWRQVFRSKKPVNNSLGLLQKTLNDRLHFESAMRTLAQYSFIEIHNSTKSYSMHNCIHDWTLAGLNKTLDKQMYEHAFDCVARSINHDDWIVLGRLKYARLAPHAARLAHPCFVRERSLSSTENDRIYDTVYIAELLRNQFQPTAAEKMYLRALADTEKVNGQDDTFTLETANNLGGLYLQQGRLEEAGQMYLRALTGKERVLGQGHSSTLHERENLGLLYRSQGKLHEAEQMLSWALAGREKAQGRSHFSTLETAINLGLLYRERNRLDEAEQLFLRTLAGTKNVRGPGYIVNLDAAHYLGLVHRDRDRLDEAEQMYLRALAGYLKLFGEEYFRCREIRVCLSNLYRYQGRTEEAAAIDQRRPISDASQR